MWQCDATRSDTQTVMPTKAMNRFVLLLAFGACAPTGPGLPPATPERVGLSSERLDRLESIVQRYVDAGQLAGAVTLVARSGREVQNIFRVLLHYMERCLSAKKRCALLLVLLIASD